MSPASESVEESWYPSLNWPWLLSEQNPFTERQLISTGLTFGSEFTFGTEKSNNSLAECPIEWMNQVSAWEDVPSALLGTESYFSAASPASPASPATRATIQTEVRTDVLANVYVRDPSDKVFTEVTLPGLFGDGSTLEGPFVRAGSERIDGFFDAASSDNSDFRFNPDTTVALPCNTDVSRCSPFDAVNVYYHVDRVAREFWVGEMGLDIDFQADAKVHVGGDGAFANADGNVMKFKLGDIFMKNAALSDDLIYHEYAHLVVASLGFSVTSGQSDQTRALSEGYADYFTATYTDDPRIGEWVVTCPDRQNCIGPDNDAEIRTLDLDLERWNWKYGFPSGDLEYGFCLRFHPADLKCKATYNNFANHYVWGMIWAAALWDIRARIGAEATDKIALEAVRRHGQQTSFLEAVSDFVSAETSLFGSQYQADLREIFRARGFILPVVQSAETFPSQPFVQVDVWPIPASEVIQVSIESASSSNGKVVLFDLTGRAVFEQRVTLSSGGTHAINVSTEHLKQGVYVLRLQLQQEVHHILVPIQR